MTPVRFFTDRRWAPCDVLVQIVDEDLREKVKTVVEENGGYVLFDSLLRDPNDYAVVSWEDIRIPDENDETAYLNFGITPEQYKELSHGWDITVEMDPFDAASLYGYSAADTLFQRGLL